MADTPMMQQYKQMKAQYEGCILFFRLGDFYEMFFEDAVLVSRELSLTLTTRDRSAPEGERTPMCGVPYHSAEAYLARLLAAGHKVAICEQVEDPALAKGIVRREVVRILTPGTVLESSMLDEKRNNYLCAVYQGAEGYGAAFADVSTGEAYVSVPGGEDAYQSLLGELGRFLPRETTLSPEAANNRPLTDFLQDRLGSVRTMGREEEYEPERAKQRIQARFGGKTPEALRDGTHPAAERALGGLLSYLDVMQRGNVTLSTLHFMEQQLYMEMDLTARRNLELVETLRGEKKGTLLEVLDFTVTAPGARMLRSWLEKPLLNPADIIKRQLSVAELHDRPMTRGDVQAALKGLPDMERVVSRIVFGNANGRDMRALCVGCEKLPELKAALSSCKSKLLAELADGLDTLPDVGDRLSRAIVDEPPHSIREGGFIRPGYDERLDELRDIVTNARTLVSEMEAEEREKTGIKTLKIGYNRVFGYYLEISKSYYAQAPEHYIRKQTLSNCERFITEPLKELETRILSAGDRMVALEGELFTQLCAYVSAESGRVQRSAQIAATADTLQSLAEAAARYRYCMPEVGYGEQLDIRDGRHPVVERNLSDGLYVPNDMNLNGSAPVAILTGPNMAGKSTYMRQAALITILAQIGSFVPAKSARLGVVDRVFTRIGAQDDLAGGRSTFMVEMTEVAEILRGATRKSLLILDEIGRGTSTYDGMSVARAVLEHICLKVGAKTLFATHYHELTEMETVLPGVKNYSVAVKKRGDEIIFLRKVVPGGADDSFGVEVAKMAGLPERVISRAKEILKALEDGSAVSAPRKQKKEEEPAQLTLSTLGADELRARVRALDVDALTPREALGVLYELAELAKR